jgi:hypothetical protein
MFAITIRSHMHKFITNIFLYIFSNDDKNFAVILLKEEK